MIVYNRQIRNCVLNDTELPVTNLIKDRQKDQIKYRHLCFAHGNANIKMTGFIITFVKGNGDAHVGWFLP